MRQQRLAATHHIIKINNDLPKKEVHIENEFALPSKIFWKNEEQLRNCPCYCYRTMYNLCNMEWYVIGLFF